MTTDKNTEDGIVLKSVNQISEYNFYVPSYQRGYRWTNHQVLDLLNDIWEFTLKNRNTDEIYCLQPVVVKEKSVGSKSWELIDGQQRLTTIYIILSFLKRDKFSIEFETRSTSGEFLKNINGVDKDTNIDFYHISDAYRTIETWFNTIDQADGQLPSISAFTNTLENLVQVIWYQVAVDSDSIDVFTRINMGKIPLTNAELVKALILKSDNFTENVEVSQRKQIEIASEWDRIEYALQDSEFWYFLNDNNKLYQSKIELILDLVAEKRAEDIDEFSTFLYFNKLITSRKSVTNIWAEIKRYYSIFEEWFANRELFHLIGFLISSGSKLEFIIKAYMSSGSKKEFITDLYTKISKIIPDHISTLSYGHFAIKNVLLLFNIETLLANKNSNMRFQFDRYKKENWDIEHIHSVQSNMPTSREHQDEWLAEVSDFMEDQKIREKIQDFKLLDPKLKISEFPELYQFIIDTYGDAEEEEEKNDISNLTLLDAGTNRSYKNAIFPIKRKTIIEREKNGVFIPLCTKNVFLKYYSKDPSHLSFWGKQDRSDYLKQIEESLNKYKNTASTYA